MDTNLETERYHQDPARGPQPTNLTLNVRTGRVASLMHATLDYPSSTNIRSKVQPMYLDYDQYSLHVLNFIII